MTTESQQINLNRCQKSLYEDVTGESLAQGCINEMLKVMDMAKKAEQLRLQLEAEENANE